MAQDYVVLDSRSDTGMTAVNKSVFRSIAEISISDIENAHQSEIRSKCFGNM